MGTVFSFISVASLFSPVIGGLLYAKSGYWGVFGVGIGLVGVDLVLRLLMIEKRVAGNYTECQPQLSSEPTLNTTTSDTEQTPLLPNITQTPDRYRLSKPTNRFTRAFPILLTFRDTGLLTAIWISFIQALLVGAFDATVPLVVSERLGFNSLKAGLLFFPLGGADFVFGSLFGWGVDRYGTKIFSVIGFTWLIPTLVSLRLPTESSVIEKFSSEQVVALFASLLALNGIGLAIVNSPSLVESGRIVKMFYEANKDLFDQAPYAQLYGISSMVFSAGLAVGPLLAGSLREHIGYGNMNAVLAIMCGLTVVLSALFIGRK